MAYQLRARAVFPVDLSLLPSTHIRQLAIAYNSSSIVLCRHLHANSIHSHRYIYINIKKNTSFIKWSYLFAFEKYVFLSNFIILQ